ncbi:hypothetical protein [Nostoc favosum]|uniref:Uncharacterized protein n=1 Tax=Nostoc favosum CHAB5714 TaxID=2780399 RepID=A0ABS8IK74_9NOSO|nr:hypothetical protein [Nostoc favosum]MCC5604244.1 hypothetical protein [Nostoc favosum CHAB5714]
MEKYNPKLSPLEKFVDKRIRDRASLYLRVDESRAKYSNGTLLLNVSKSYAKDSLGRFGVYELQLRNIKRTDFEEALSVLK